MWRDYFGFVAPALAVLNGFIAIIIALLPVRRSVAKLRLGVTALIIGVIAVGAGAYGNYAARSDVNRQQAERAQVREQIENFILEGRTLLGQIKDAQRELPTRAADEWALRAETYLRDKLGDRYVGRFRKDVNELYGDAAIAAPRMGYWRAVRNRVVNLEMLAAELSEAPAVSSHARSSSAPAAPPASNQ